MKKISTCIAVIAMSLLFVSCNNSETKNANTSSGDDDTMRTTPVCLVPLRERVLTREEQAALTPDAVIKSLKEGNERFASNSVTARDHSAMVRLAAQGQ